MFGPGRPKATPEILAARALTAEDIAGYTPAQGQNSVKKFRDHHHRIANYFALGLRPGEIAELTGFSLVRISTFNADPAFRDLVESKRPEVEAARQEEVDGDFFNMVRIKRLAQSELLDRLEDEDTRQKVTNQQLIAIQADMIDRTGYPKRSIAVNVNMDFAARLERAVERTQKLKAIEGELAPALSAPNSTVQQRSGGGEGELSDVPRLLDTPPQPALRRRA